MGDISTELEALRIVIQKMRDEIRELREENEELRRLLKERNMKKREIETGDDKGIFYFILHKIIGWILKAGIWKINTLLSGTILIWCLFRLSQGDEFYEPILMIVAGILGISIYQFIMKKEK